MTGIHDVTCNGGQGPCGWCREQEFDFDTSERFSDEATKPCPALVFCDDCAVAMIGPAGLCEECTALAAKEACQ